MALTFDQNNCFLVGESNLGFIRYVYIIEFKIYSGRSNPKNIWGFNFKYMGENICQPLHNIKLITV